jgi:hypothetical protein
MAKMYPRVFPYSGDKMRKAERIFYDACDSQLDDSWTVLYEVQWFGRRNQGNERGDADFLLMNSSYGIFCVEVKGGQQIFVRDNQWYTVPHGLTEAVKIRDPYTQAAESKSVLWSFLKANIQGIRLAGALGHFVVFPGISLLGDISLSARKSLTCDRDSIKNLPESITQIANSLGQKNSFTENQIEQIRELIFPSCELISESRIKVNEARGFIDEMTIQQVQAFSMMTNWRELKVVGGAGTGKTSIAFYRARQLAAQGARILYLCNSFAAAEYLRGILPEEPGGNLTVESIDSLYSRVIRNHFLYKSLADDLSYELFLTALGRDSEFGQVLSEAWLEAAIEEGLFFDGLIIDEAQNIPLQIAELVTNLLPNRGTRYLYVFGDRDQNIFYQKSTAMDFDTGIPDVLLSTNCRSTAEIVSAAEYLLGRRKNIVGAVGVPPVLFYHPDFKNLELKVGETLVQSPNQAVIVEAVKYLVETVGLGIDADIQHLIISGAKLADELRTASVKAEAEFGSIINTADWTHSPSEEPSITVPKTFFLKKRTTLPQMVGLEVDGLVIELGGGMISYGFVESLEQFGEDYMSGWESLFHKLFDSWKAAKDARINGDSQIEFSPMQIASQSELWTRVLDGYLRTIYSTMTRARYAVVFVGNAFELSVMQAMFGDRCKQVFVEPTDMN